MFFYLIDFTSSYLYYLDKLPMRMSAPTHEDVSLTSKDITLDHLFYFPFEEKQIYDFFHTNNSITKVDWWVIESDNTH